MCPPRESREGPHSQGGDLGTQGSFGLWVTFQGSCTHTQVSPRVQPGTGGRLSRPSSSAPWALPPTGRRRREAGEGARWGWGWQGHEPQATAALFCLLTEVSLGPGQRPHAPPPARGTQVGAQELGPRSRSALCHVHTPPSCWGWREPPREQLGAHVPTRLRHLTCPWVGHRHRPPGG